MNKTMNWLKSLYAKPTAESIALRELEEAKRSLLDAQSIREYAESMCNYHETKIKRLTTYLHKAIEEKP